MPMGAGSQTEVLVQWEHLPDKEATWEEYSALHWRFPSFHLEDKVKVWLGRNAVTHPKRPVLLTYKRRNKAKRGDVELEDIPRGTELNIPRGTELENEQGSAGNI